MSLKIPSRIGSVHRRAMCPLPPVFPHRGERCLRVCLQGQAFKHTPIAAMVEQRKETDDVAGAARPAGARGDLPSDDVALSDTGDDETEGEYGLPEAPEPGPEASAPAPPQVAELAGACVRF